MHPQRPPRRAGALALPPAAACCHAACPASAEAPRAPRSSRPRLALVSHTQPPRWHAPAASPPPPPPVPAPRREPILAPAVPSRLRIAAAPHSPAALASRCARARLRRPSGAFCSHALARRVSAACRSLRRSLLPVHLRLLFR
jgi:hypothetical protein